MPDTFHENDFRRALVREMRKFILELGKDFTFIGEEYPIQIGEEDYRIDLLFFHRSLQCLVAMELKTGKFKPEYVSKMDFYLEGLDRQIKKLDETYLNRECAHQDVAHIRRSRDIAKERLLSSRCNER